MSKPILGYEPGPEGHECTQLYRYCVDGELIRTFDEAWQAMQYMDEDTDHCQELATVAGCSMKRTVYDDTGYISAVLQEDVVRPVFDRTKDVPGRGFAAALLGAHNAMKRGLK